MDSLWQIQEQACKKEALKPAELKNSTVVIFISETIATLEGTAIYRARWLYIAILFSQLPQWYLNGEAAI